MRRDRRPTFVDLFAGCGGLSLGLCLSGWKGFFGIEFRTDAFSTFRANFLQGNRLSMEWPVWLEQRAWDIGELLKRHETELTELRGQVDLVCGGPPCQGFSYSGKRDRTDPRNLLVFSFITFVKLVAPTVILLENVPGFRVEHGKKARVQRRGATKGRAAISGAQRLRDNLGELYILDDCLVRASDLGVPQIRDRYFAVGVRKDKGFAPQPGWAGELIRDVREDFLKSKKLGERPVSARQALEDLELERKGTVDYEPDYSCNSRLGFLQVDYGAPRKKNPYLKLMRQGMNGQAPNSLRIPRHSADVEARYRLVLREFPRGRRLNDDERRRIGVKKQRIVPLADDLPAHTLTTLPDDLLHYEEPRILTAVDGG